MNPHSVDATYGKIKKQWHDFYRAVVFTAATVDVQPNVSRKAHYAGQLFQKILGTCHTTLSRVITHLQNARLPTDLRCVQRESPFPDGCMLR